MTQERIQTRYPLGGPFATQAELEQAITQAITTHRQDFFPLLERLVDVGDTRVNLSQENPLTAVKEWPISTTSPTSPRAA